MMNSRTIIFSVKIGHLLKAEHVVGYYTVARVQIQTNMAPAEVTTLFDKNFTEKINILIFLGYYC